MIQRLSIYDIFANADRCFHCGHPEESHVEAGGCPPSPDDYDWCQNRRCSEFGALMAWWWE